MSEKEKEIRRQALQCALASAVEGARVSTIAAAAANLQNGNAQVREDDLALLMKPFPRSRFTS